MIALERGLDKEIIQCLSYSDTEFIGDELCNCPYLIDGDGYYVRPDNHSAMFRLVNNDPTLKHVVLGDSFESVNPRDEDTLDEEVFDEDMEDAIDENLLDVLGAIHRNKYVKCLTFMHYYASSAIWREGPSRDALINVVRDKKSIEWMQV
jgi:hypothetical protein